MLLIVSLSEESDRHRAATMMMPELLCSLRFVLSFLRGDSFTMWQQARRGVREASRRVWAMIERAAPIDV